jgi:hypothetical protein
LIFWWDRYHREYPGPTKAVLRGGSREQQLI